jgi:iron(III) transport system permease protein
MAMTETATSLPAPPLPSRRAPGVMARLRYLEPSTLLWILLVAALLFLVAVPIGKLLDRQLREAGQRRLHLANYSHRLWPRALPGGTGQLADARYRLRSLSTVFAVPMAWAVSRTDMPGKG